MTNVSKKILTKQTQKQLFSQFTGMFHSANKSDVSLLFDSLFSETEKIMFIKRLANVLLIQQKYSTYAIAKSLHVSDSTVREARKKCERVQYDSLISVTRKKSFNKQQFWSTLEVLLRAGLPPRGKNRWEWLNDHTPPYRG